MALPNKFPEAGLLVLKRPPLAGCCWPCKEFAVLFIELALFPKRPVFVVPLLAAAFPNSPPGLVLFC